MFARLHAIDVTISPGGATLSTRERLRTLRLRRSLPDVFRPRVDVSCRPGVGAWFGEVAGSRLDRSDSEEAR